VLRDPFRAGSRARYSEVLEPSAEFSA